MKCNYLSNVGQLLLRRLSVLDFSKVSDFPRSYPPSELLVCLLEKKTGSGTNTVAITINFDNGQNIQYEKIF